MTREEILQSIRDLAHRTGKVPGRMSFEAETGIGRQEWYGRYWARWGDAVVEAGLQPNEKTAAADRDVVLAAYLKWVLELGRLPTDGELRVKNSTDKSFPGREAVRAALGLKADRVRALVEYAEMKGAPTEAISMLRSEATALPPPSDALDARIRSATDGFVYLMKSGRSYKIGRTNTLDRRQYEIGVQLPERLEPVHSIRTDDPSGIEAYWHNRFRDKRLNGEWFRLTAEDVRTFKRRKFM